MYSAWQHRLENISEDIAPACQHSTMGEYLSPLHAATKGHIALLSIIEQHLYLAAQEIHVCPSNKLLKDIKIYILPVAAPFFATTKTNDETSRNDPKSCFGLVVVRRAHSKQPRLFIFECFMCVFFLKKNKTKDGQRAIKKYF